jgi:hypothetical protein
MPASAIPADVTGRRPCPGFRPTRARPGSETGRGAVLALPQVGAEEPGGRRVELAVGVRADGPGVTAVGEAEHG